MLSNKWSGNIKDDITLEQMAAERSAKRNRKNNKKNKETVQVITKDLIRNLMWVSPEDQKEGIWW